MVPRSFATPCLCMLPLHAALPACPAAMDCHCTRPVSLMALLQRPGPCWPVLHSPKQRHRGHAQHWVGRDAAAASQSQSSPDTVTRRQRPSQAAESGKHGRPIGTLQTQLLMDSSPGLELLDMKFLKRVYKVGMRLYPWWHNCCAKCPLVESEVHLVREGHVTGCRIHLCTCPCLHSGVLDAGGAH